MIFGISLAYLLSRTKKLLILYPLCAYFLVFCVMNVGRYSGNDFYLGGHLYRSVCSGYSNTHSILEKVSFGVDIPDANAPFGLMKAQVVRKYIYRLPNVIQSTDFETAYHILPNIEYIVQLGNSKINKWTFTSTTSI